MLPATSQPESTASCASFAAAAGCGGGCGCGGGWRLQLVPDAGGGSRGGRRTAAGDVEAAGARGGGRPRALLGCRRIGTAASCRGRCSSCAGLPNHVAR